MSVVKRALRAHEWICAAAVAAFAISPAAAASIRASEGVITIRGSIERGDADDFAAALRAHAPVRLVTLDGPGGSLREAIRIGDMIRKARLATLVDAGSVFCDSACTMLFAAGVARHYVNAEDMMEGIGGLYGLGYHLSWSRGDRVTPSMKSDEGIRLMDAYYARMGARGASRLARQASISTVWRPNAATAMKLGLATTTKPFIAPGAR